MDAVSCVKQIFEHANVQIESITDSFDDGHAVISVIVPEADSGIWIGFHGETVDALQTIVNLMSNNASAEYVPVTIDVNGYRQKRISYIESLAKRAAEQSVSSQREIILPPLTPYERRHIHMTLKEDARVTTYSEGEGSNRRLIVRPVVTE